MTEDEEKDASKAIGGHARAEALPAKRRSEIAKKAALARWGSDAPQATHEAPVMIGKAELVAAVLPDGTRLLAQGSFLQALGRSRTPKGGTGGGSTVDGLPAFLQAEQLKPFISEELSSSTTPVLFRLRRGQKAVGYKAELLPMVCEVYLSFRDSYLEAKKEVPANFAHIIKACDMLTRGFARVGIIALIDEATGYQEVRDRWALQAILDQFLRKELAAWAKRFPDEFYQQIFRLRGWEWKGMQVNRPQVVAHYTKDIVYARLAPGILRELEQRNPKDEKGNRKGAHHQWLTEDVGHPALAQHIHAATGLMRATPGSGAVAWRSFMTLLDRAFPKRGDTLLLPFMSENPRAVTT